MESQLINILIISILPTIGLHGSRGSSKSWGLSLFMYIYQLEGNNIWSGMELNRQFFPNYVYLDKPLEVGGDIFDSGWDYIAKCAVAGIPFPVRPIVMGFDEFQYRSDSRLSYDMQNIVYSYLFIQGRKRQTKIILTSIKKRYIDTRDRDQEDIVIKCFKLHNTLGYCQCGRYGKTCFKKTPYLPQIHNRKCFDEECELPHWFDWLINDVHNLIGKELKWYHPEPIFQLYDTESMNAPLSDINTKQLQDALKGMTNNG